MSEKPAYPLPYLAFDVGCYECGEPSGVLGLYATEAEAEAACERAADRQKADWHGQHSMEVHDLRVAGSPYADPPANADEGAP